MSDPQPPPGPGYGPPQQQAPPPQPPRRKKGLSKGCIIALVVTGAIGLVCGGVFTWMGYEVYSNPDVQRVGRAIGEGIEVSQEAMKAPGTAELRAAGCDQAMVMLPEHMERLMRAVEPDGGLDEQETDFPPMVICQYQYGGDEMLSCEQVATTYGDAIASPPAELGVQVQRQGGGRPACSGRYAPDGTRLGSLESGSRKAARQVP